MSYITTASLLLTFFLLSSCNQAQGMESVEKKPRTVELEQTVQEDFELACGLTNSGKAEDSAQAFSILTQATHKTQNQSLLTQIYWRIGMMLYLGQGITQDFKKAYSIFISLSRQKNNMIIEMGARCMLGILLLTGEAGNQDVASAREYLKIVARQTVNMNARVTAWAQLGNIYLFGIGVRRDVDSACVFLQAAANQNHNTQISALARIALQEINASIRLISLPRIPHQNGASHK